jgi:phosphopantetheine--protein transferase-like protein
MTLSWMNLPAAVIFQIAPFDGLNDEVMEAEAASLPPVAGERRRRDYAAGRNLARRLLSMLGHGAHPLIQTASGAPHWPHGVAGSISHCRDLVFAAAAPADQVEAIGIDIENLARFHDGLADHILTAAERARLPTEETERQQRMAIVFSAKEAFYKYQSALFGERLTFQDAEVRIHAGEQGFSILMTNPREQGRLAANAEGFYALNDTHVATMVVRRPPPGNAAP